jgi:hypothetical protein
LSLRSRKAFCAFLFCARRLCEEVSKAVYRCFGRGDHCVPLSSCPCRPPGHLTCMKQIETRNLEHMTQAKEPRTGPGMECQARRPMILEWVYNLGQVCYTTPIRIPLLCAQTAKPRGRHSPTMFLSVANPTGRRRLVLRTLAISRPGRGNSSFSVTVRSPSEALCRLPEAHSNL